ncbi:MAG: ribosomal RNA small subunit methyltransferase A [Clostridia bacterium]|nr:ribosomal RNA small subunit methyltransferase A [Clostridia bacterium]
MDLCSVSAVKRLLSENSLSPRKSLGQNFLINARIPEMIAESSSEFARKSISNNVPIGVIEIGPGIGALTDELANYFDRVVSVEIDPGLSLLFKKTFAGYNNVELISADILKTDIPALVSDCFNDVVSEGGNVSVCANLPYYITTPVIMKLLESFGPTVKNPLSSVTVMIQSEVADRLCAQPGSSDYGSITASVRLRANVVKLFDVSPGSFYPPPKVNSTVIRIIPHGGIREVFPGAPDDNTECRKFFELTSKIIEASFSQRRKTLTNSLSGLFPKDKTASALVKIGKNPDVRGERLSTEDFCALTHMLLTEKE